MGFKHFNQQIGLYIFLVVASSIVLGYSLQGSQTAVYAVLSAVILVISVWRLLFYFNKVNREVTFFIKAVKNEDTTLRFSHKTGSKVINEFHQSLNELNLILQKTKLQSQLRERYFSEILQNIGTGVIVCNSKGFVTDVNPAALELLGLQTFTNLVQLDKIDPLFRKQLMLLEGGQKQLLFLKKKTEEVQLITRCSSILIKDEAVKLMTLQDIHGELERKEMDSWVKLIRVLSHEIMNSLAPVTSISQSLKGMWNNKLQHTDTINTELVANTIDGLDVIGERGQGLIRFVQSYRMLTQMPRPELKLIHVTNLFESLSILSSPYRDEKKTDIQFHYPDQNLQILADEQLIIQVMINLIKNAVEALKCQKNRRVDVETQQDKNGQTRLLVTDNGPGIPDEMMDEIFVPFFTTKTEGTGIGLSHSRQIMKAHGGSIKCYSQPGKTVFEILFQ